MDKELETKCRALAVELGKTASLELPKLGRMTSKEIIKVVSHAFMNIAVGIIKAQPVWDSDKLTESDRDKMASLCVRWLTHDMINSVKSYRLGSKCLDVDDCPMTIIDKGVATPVVPSSSEVQ